MKGFGKNKITDSYLWERYKSAALRKPDQCPDDIELAAFIDGTLSAEQKASIEAHLTVCRDCLDMVIEINMQAVERKAAAREKTKTSWASWKHLAYDFSFRWLAPAVATILVIMFAAQFGSRTFNNQSRMHAVVSSSISFGLSIAEEAPPTFLSEEATGGI
jgi:anti-sigma factor RsiW